MQIVHSVHGAECTTPSGMRSTIALYKAHSFAGRLRTQSSHLQCDWMQAASHPGVVMLANNALRTYLGKC